MTGPPPRFTLFPYPPLSRSRKKNRAGGFPPPLGFSRSSRAAYWHFGSPSLFAGAVDVDPLQLGPLLVLFTFAMLAYQPSPAVEIAGVVLPVDCTKLTPPRRTTRCTSPTPRNTPLRPARA